MNFGNVITSPRHCVRDRERVADTIFRRPSTLLAAFTILAHHVSTENSTVA
jgi:hypothetical protein